MKKVLAGIAILAIAASAQATLLASWGSLGAASGDATVMDGYKVYDTASGALGVTDMSAYNGASIGTATTTAYNYFMRLGSLTKTSGGAGIQFGYKVADDAAIDNATISGNTHVSNAGPEKMNWFVDDPTGTAVATITSTGTTLQEGDSWNLGTLSGEGNVYLVADLAAGRTGTATGAITGNFDFEGTAVQLNGTVRETAVPEPATMSLLGLGALAIALRRKLRK